MLIDWFTVAAQAINFLILVALLRVFLYRRILDAMDERERTIANRLKQADEKLEEADHQLEEYRERQDALEEERETVLRKAKERAAAHHRDLVADAREDVARSRRLWQQALAHEKEAFLADLRRRASEEVVAIARETLDKMAGTDLEHRMVDRLMDEIESSHDGIRSELGRTLRECHGEVRVRSAFPLGDDARQRIRGALDGVADYPNGGDLQLVFREDPSVVCGLEIEAGKYKIGWSFADHLERFAEELDTVILDETRKHHRQGESTATPSNSTHG